MKKAKYYEVYTISRYNEKLKRYFDKVTYRSKHRAIKNAIERSKSKNTIDKKKIISDLTNMSCTFFNDIKIHKTRVY